MYRIFRPLCVLASAGLLLGVPAVQAADYVLGQQKLIGSTGAGPSGISVADFDSVDPAIATAPAFNRALVVWSADDPAAEVESGEDDLHFVDDEFEIFARILSTSFISPRGRQFRVSTMGNNLETDGAVRERFDANNPAVAWNPVSEEFLVVWSGDDDAAPLVDGEFEIFGQRVNVDGELVGERFRISVMGDDTATDPALRQAYDAVHPVIAVNTETGDYLVAWQGDTDALADDEMEVYGRMLGMDGIPAGPQSRISFAGTDGDAARGAIMPDLVYNPYSSSYFAAWQSDGGAGQADDEYEIFLQEIDATGAVVNSPMRVSSMGPDGDAGFDAALPSLAVNPATGDVLVAWHGDTTGGDLVEGEQEVFGRVFSPAAGAFGSQERISVMGSDDETDAAKRRAYEGTNADAAWSESDSRFLVAWRGDTDAEIEQAAESDAEPVSLVDGEYEIFGRFMETDGTPGDSQFRISVQGNDRESDAESRAKYDANTPTVAFSDGVILTAWSGDTDTNGSFNNVNQIFAQRVAMASTELQLLLPEGYQSPRAPDPIRLDFEMENVGDITASNVMVRVGMSNEFPMTLTGCVLVEGNVCTLGDIAANDSARFSVILATDHLQLGDEQGTTLVTTTTADTALVSDTDMLYQLFVSATLFVEGGAGAAAWFWLLLGFAPLSYVARRRSRN